TTTRLNVSVKSISTSCCTSSPSLMVFTDSRMSSFASFLSCIILTLIVYKKKHMSMILTDLILLAGVIHFDFNKRNQEFDNIV
ncbi:hypothetical protein L9F63_010548, partial [Diploptera punctata]